MVELNSVKDKSPSNNKMVAVYGGDVEVAGLEVSVGYYSPDYNCYCCVLDENDLEFEICDIDYWCELPKMPAN